MIRLKNTTLICVDGRGQSEASFKSIEASMNNIEYAKVVFITADSKAKSTKNININYINQMSWNDYNEFILKDLTNYFDTEYVLLTQDDGFVSNPNKWSDEFFKYDYIGAPWPLHLVNNLLNNLSRNKDFFGLPFKTNVPKLENYDIHNYRVGNGGFSFRSKKLCNFTQQFSDKYPERPEDCIISLYEKHNLNINGLKIAPVELAAQFSVEEHNEFNPYKDTSKTFGFHGFN